MISNQSDANDRSALDRELTLIADYVCDVTDFSDVAYDTALLCLKDSLACAMMTLEFDACKRHLGATVPGTTVPNGVPVPGTAITTDPVTAAFNIGTLIRWIDFNDTWLAAEWGHPSDNFGAILASAYFASRNQDAEWTVRDVLTAAIQAYEIQGILALENSFNRLGIDHVVLVKLASTAVATRLLGGNHQQVCDALSHAFVDGQSLRTYRHAPNTVSRKSWAAGDATSRAVRFALMTLAGEPGMRNPISTPKWGFQDVVLDGKPLVIERPLGSYVMENILFKISFPAEFHAQTAVECAMSLYQEVKPRFEDIERVEITTQEPAIRIISKTGPLYNPADRDHCLQYMVAIPLIFGRLTAADYEDDVANDPRVDVLRNKMTVVEDPQYSIDYLDPDQRAIPNAVQVFFSDGSSSQKVEVRFPIGHRKRREEGIPLLSSKFQSAVQSYFPTDNNDAWNSCLNAEQLMSMPVQDLLDSWRIPAS